MRGYASSVVKFTYRHLRASGNSSKVARKRAKIALFDLEVAFMQGVRSEQDKSSN